MKKILPLLLALAALLLCAAPALATPQGLVQGGYDAATGKLEGGFKIMAIKRVFSEDECYPPVNQVATTLRQELDTEVVIAPNLDSVQGIDLINVIANETGCDRLVLALRSGPKARVFVLDSDYGPVYLAGGKGNTGESAAGSGGPLRDLTSATKEFRMREADGTSRLEVLCPDGDHPMGGGMYNATPLGKDGEGVYSHSYERLGAQGGFHDTATLIDPSQKSTATHHVDLQVVCGQGLVPSASPHATTYVHRHESASVTAHCPKGTQIYSGGFQRTNFTTPGVVRFGGHIYGGDYITESRADGNGWRVSGAATGENGGELTAIAYCGEDSSLPIKEVSTEVSVGEGKAVSATTPRCPKNHVLISGGFSFGDSDNALFADGYFTRAGTWAATGYGWFGSANLTAYGYCAQARDTLERSDFPGEPPPGPPPSDEGGGNTVLYIAIGAVALIVIALFLRRRQVVRRRRKGRQPTVVRPRRASR